jgi:beta-glucanase (GH16 family)
LTVAYGSPEIGDQGWTVHGNGGVATKTAFNLLGGYVEFDMDVSGVHTGVNANIYSISPGGLGAGGYTPDKYCDGADNDKPWCLEVDWIESNGNCGGATTLHTIPGPGPNGCTSWGCRASYHYGGVSSFHMRVDFSADGAWTTTRDGQSIGTLSPTPSANDWGVIAATMTSTGAVIYSSEWTGWVPVEDCGTSGDLPSSYFSIKNLKVYGSVVQGPTPTKCPSTMD